MVAKSSVMCIPRFFTRLPCSTVRDEITRHLAGKLYADKGYIGQGLFKTLWQRGLHLITGIRRNMRNYLMPLADKIMLRKRFVIETVLDRCWCTNQLLGVGRQLSLSVRRCAATPACRAGSSG